MSEASHLSSTIQKKGHAFPKGHHCWPKFQISSVVLDCGVNEGDTFSRMPGVHHNLKK